VERPLRQRRDSIFWPAAALVTTTLAVISTGYAVWCHWRPGAVEEPIVTAPPEIAEPPEPRRVLVPSDFAALPGWAEDPVSEALPALLRSCDVFSRRPPDAEIGPAGVGGRVADWQPLCREVASAADGRSLRRVLETRTLPVQVLDNDQATGLFTGYYEPLLRGSRSRSATYDVPLYRTPGDLVTLDLAEFSDRFEEERISGRVEGATFVPYHERAEIGRGALAGRGLELVWIDDPVDAFFLHIQGSGRIRLAEGGEMRVGYGGQNGRPYFAIGRELVARGALTLEQVSLQSIRAWLEAHPEEAETVMATNPSFVFFRELEGDGPVGTLGVALTPRRSLAVDRAFLPLGVPVWLDALAPVEGPAAAAALGAGDRPLRRLMVAQDTGGAIKGPVRGDVFWGHGDEAEWIAGHMKHEGRLWLLLPREVVHRLATGPAGGG
jgi:membrane-bound lytic murein transglycosylase A